MAFIPAANERITRGLNATEVPPSRGLTTATLAGIGAVTAAQMIIQSRRPSIGPIELSCTLSEDHGFENDIPGVPVQRNVTENDTIIRRPARLTITGVISDMASTFADQFKLLANVAARRKYSSKSNRDTAWARIQTLDKSHEPFEVFTHFAVYPDMVFERVSVVEDGTSDMVLRMQLRQFQQVNVRVQKYLSDLVLDVADEPDNLGVQGATDVSNLNIEESIAEITEGVDETALGITDISVFYN